MGWFKKARKRQEIFVTLTAFSDFVCLSLLLSFMCIYFSAVFFFCFLLSTLSFYVRSFVLLHFSRFSSFLLLDAFATKSFSNGPVRYSVSVCPLFPLEQPDNGRRGFHEIWYWKFLLIHVGIFQSELHSDQQRRLYMKDYIWSWARQCDWVGIFQSGNPALGNPSQRRGNAGNNPWWWNRHAAQAVVGRTLYLDALKPPATVWWTRKHIHP